MAASEARKHLADAHRIVVKVGTHVVTHDGVELALGRIMEIVEGLARLRHAGREIVLVSSGAVGMGMRVLGLKERPRSLGMRQACAAVGQGHLMGLYTDAFAQFGVIAAQVLLTQEDLADRDRALCLRTTLMRLLELGVIPVLNENDSVSVAELVEHRRVQSGAAETPPAAFGDNDGLSARVAVSLDADLLVLLTNVGGLYTANPRSDPDGDAHPRAGGRRRRGAGARRRRLRGRHRRHGEQAGGGAAGVRRGDGGADRGRRRAARHRARARGRRRRDADRACAERRPARIRHIAVGRAASRRAGGQRRRAARAGRREGVAAAHRRRRRRGDFDKGDVVEIRDGSGRVHGRGLVNYAADACRKLAGRHSDDIDAILGWRGYDALITRDNLVMGAVVMSDEEHERRS